MKIFYYTLSTFTIVALVTLGIRIFIQPPSNSTSSEIIPAYSTHDCTPSAAQLPTGVFGLAIPFPLDELTKIHLIELNVPMVRLEFRWDALQPSPNEFIWTESDAAIAWLTDHNITILATIDHPPTWAHNITTLSRDFNDFLSAFTARYAHRITYYEIFNEPNLRGYGWPFQTGVLQHDAKLYASVLTNANVAIRKYDPNGFIMLGGLSPDGISPHEYLAEVYAHSNPDCFDIVSYHPYGQSNRLTELQDELEAFLATQGDAHKPVWFGEFGTSDEVLVPSILHDVTHHAPALNALIWFSLRDLKSTGWNFGLVEYSGEKKPAFETFKAFLNSTE